MSKQLALKDLKVKSFITKAQVANQQTVKGGLVNIGIIGERSDNPVICATSVKTCGVCPVITGL